MLESIDCSNTTDNVEVVLVLGKAVLISMKEEIMWENMLRRCRDLQPNTKYGQKWEKIYFRKGRGSDKRSTTPAQTKKESEWEYNNGCNQEIEKNC